MRGVGEGEADAAVELGALGKRRHNGWGPVGLASRALMSAAARSALLTPTREATLARPQVSGRWWPSCDAHIWKWTCLSAAAAALQVASTVAGAQAQGNYGEGHRASRHHRHSSSSCLLNLSVHLIFGGSLVLILAFFFAVSSVGTKEWRYGASCSGRNRMILKFSSIILIQKSAGT